MKQSKISGVFAIIYSILIIFFPSCEKSNSYHKIQGMIWNTTYHITFQGPQTLQDSILPILNEVSHSLSIFENNSIVNQLNNSKSVMADRHLLKVYDKSKEINHLSSGMFDPTVSPLITAWGFGPGHKPTTDTLAIDSLLKFIGIDKTFRNGNEIIKEDPRTQFNFSAIAKGYGCDEVGEMFKRNGIKNYMIEIGGELSLSGKSPNGVDWRISIDAPSENNIDSQESAYILSITNAGIATSGNYRNYRKENGTTLAHTISPMTGRPFFNEVLSATVIAPSCMEADALATTAMASNLENAERILKEYDAEGMLILKDSVWMTTGFSKYIISEVSEPGKKDRN